MWNQPCIEGDLATHFSLYLCALEERKLRISGLLEDLYKYQFRGVYIFYSGGVDRGGENKVYLLKVSK